VNKVIGVICKFTEHDPNTFVVSQTFAETPIAKLTVTNYR